MSTTAIGSAMSYDRIVLELRAWGVPLAKAEQCARQTVERRGDSVSSKQKKRPRKSPAKLSPEVALFFAVLRSRGIPQPVRELKFHERRGWRFDFAWPDGKIALEVEGGVWSGGRHTRGAGFLEDMDKYNAAAARGWRLIRTTPAQLPSSSVIDQIAELLEVKP